MINKVLAWFVAFNNTIKLCIHICAQLCLRRSFLCFPRNFAIVLLLLQQGRVAQLLTCLATDASLTADPGAMSLILARSHTFVEIDHEIISTVNLLPSAETFKKGCCQLKAKICAQSPG